MSCLEPSDDVDGEGVGYCLSSFNFGGFTLSLTLADFISSFGLTEILAPYLLIISLTDSFTSGSFDAVSLAEQGQLGLSDLGPSGCTSNMHFTEVNGLQERKKSNIKLNVV